MVYTEYEQVDGKKIAYIRTGEWKENVIVFFHGYCQEDSEGMCYDFGGNGEFNIYSETDEDFFVLSAALPSFESLLDEFNEDLFNSENVGIYTGKDE